MWFSNRTQHPRWSIDPSRKPQKSIRSGKKYGALLTDLFKTFDCLLHTLIVPKLYAYGVSLESLKLINSCLTDRKQRNKINDQYSSWSIVAVDVPKRSILGLHQF